MDESKNVLTIKTVQIQPIRNIFTALKEILTDATITYTQYGIKIINFDKSHTILVDLILYARDFETYYCKYDKIIACANSLHLFRIINSLSNDDVLSMYIEDEDYHDGIVSHLGFQYDNGNRKQCCCQKLRLLEPDMEELIVPEVEFSSVLTMPTVDFQKIIRDLNPISDRIEIKTVGNDIMFSCEGTFANTVIYRSESDGNMNFIQKPNHGVIVQGEFSLKSLNSITKFTPLCTHLEICLGNNLPLIITYNATVGKVNLCISPLPPS